jgi:formate dehydrogenase
MSSPSANDAGTGRANRPGGGRRAGAIYSKGRELETSSVEEVRDILGTRELRRDLLIEYLHLIQDRFGHLSAGHLQALASEMGLAMAEVYEVATFYAHFDIVLDDETAPPAVTVRVCDSLTCEMFGAEALLRDLPEALGSEVRVVRAPCMGRCAGAPAVSVGHCALESADVDSVSAAVAEGRTRPKIPAYLSYEDYLAGGGYALLRDCYEGRRSAEELITELQDSGLRGLGGAGFPAGRKWQLVRQQPKPRVLAVNGDEGEPGTFKDRHYLELDPHRFLEGTLIAGWACEIETIYIYIRDEYPAVIEILQRELERLRKADLLGGMTIDLRRGAGAYICGEESAMMESIEGKRGLPRHKPPFPTEVGLFGLPTLAHNVETLYWVREIVEKGADWFAGHGRHGRKGLRSFSVSGRVREPGVKLAPAGVTISELIEEYCGGMAEGHNFKGYLPGGASGGILPASLADVPLDFDTLQEHDCFIGSAAIIVLSDQDDLKAVALNLMRFFEDESCGQCTPCRNGTEKAVRLMAAKDWDRDALEALAEVMGDASICGLGQAAPNPLLSVLRHFPEEL